MSEQAKISVEVNNGKILSLSQEKHDGSILLRSGRVGEVGSEWVISAGDFVMLMNYYRYQKAAGLEIFGGLK
jgi:hypothetical protein